MADYHKIICPACGKEEFVDEKAIMCICKCGYKIHVRELPTYGTDIAVTEKLSAKPTGADKIVIFGSPGVSFKEVSKMREALGKMDLIQVPEREIPLKHPSYFTLAYEEFDNEGRAVGGILNRNFKSETVSKECYDDLADQLCVAEGELAKYKRREKFETIAFIANISVMLVLTGLLIRTAWPILKELW